MSQNHKNAKKMKSQIHCPVSGCLYSIGSERHFTEKKFLNQHIAKVHAEKKYSCAKCQKSFGLDWWRKHHEKTCGMEWKCDCGGKYTSRESLLTHARRSQHKLPDYVISSDKMKNSKVNSKPTENPVIVLIQPIIQNVTCFQPVQTTAVTPRPILPKTTQPVILTLPVSMGVIASAPTSNNVSPVILEQTQENALFNSLQSFNASDGSMLSTSNQLFKNTNKTDTLANSSHEEFQKTVGTQTIDDTVDNSAKLRQSQASQCTRRKPKSLKVGIESTHTQTAESAVVKIKKRRSRRKSVAITTEPSMLTNQMLDPESSFWPGFKDFFLQQSDNLGSRLFKNSTSTQTSTLNNSKILCDSETLTDNELLKFPWEDAMKEKVNSETCSSELQMLTDDTLSVLPVNIDNNTLSELNIFSSNSLNSFSEIKTPVEENNCQFSSNSLNRFSEIKTSEQDNCQFSGNPLNNFSEIKTSSEKSDHCHQFSTDSLNNFTEIKTTEENVHCQNNGNDVGASDEKCTVFSMFGNCDKSATGNKVPSAPTLSDIHTQTMASAVLDYNLLANMETQTTDDFTFSDLEFSDTETQTPWDDFLNIDDSPLQTDQLSIEIQTDFSSFATGLNLDPVEFINSVDVQNMIPACSSKETSGVNTETQTLDKFCFPQFTNSESQTLDMPDFVFD